MEKIGLVFGKSSPFEFSFAVNPEKIPRFGEYIVAVNRDGEEVLGIVRDVTNFNRILAEEGLSFEYLIRNLQFSRELVERNEVIIANAGVLGVVKDGQILPNRTPVKPSSPVNLASTNLLRSIFGSGSGEISIGNLLARPEVQVNLDLNQLILRHFAVLAITGGGKSNVVSILVDEIVRKLNGSVVLVDPHGEYVHYTFGDSTERKKNVVPAGIRPERLEPWEFASLVGVDRERAAVQRMHLERIFTTVQKEGAAGKKFVERILDIVEDWINIASSLGDAEYYDSIGVLRYAHLDRQDLNALCRIKEYVATFLRRYEDLLTQNDMLAAIKPSYLNIINLSGFDEGQMRVVVSYLLRNILVGRINFIRGKRSWGNICPAVSKPLLVVFEEGHIFAPKGVNNDVTLWLGRVAREGRKFGVGLGIVSQRPKRLNDDVLSQCNTKIILRITEPNDQRYVQQASEQISEELLKDIASLGVGEAVIVGPAVKLPVAVKVRKFEGNYGGRDIDVLKEWKRGAAQKSEFSLRDFASE